MKVETLGELVKAIAHEEGFFDCGDAPNRPQRNNNPGDLRACSGFTWVGQIGIDEKGFCIFDTIENGWRALTVDVGNHAAHWPEQTIGQFIGGAPGWGGYAPASDHNDPVGYARVIAAAVGGSPDTKFDEL
jgi:hypothetical protein